MFSFHDQSNNVGKKKLFIIKGFDSEICLNSRWKRNLKLTITKSKINVEPHLIFFISVFETLSLISFYKFHVLLIHSVLFIRFQDHFPILYPF